MRLMTKDCKIVIEGGDPAAPYMVTPYLTHVDGWDRDLFRDDDKSFRITCTRTWDAPVRYTVFHNKFRALYKDLVEEVEGVKSLHMTFPIAGGEEAVYHLPVPLFNAVKLGPGKLIVGVYPETNQNSLRLAIRKKTDWQYRKSDNAAVMTFYEPENPDGYRFANYNRTLVTLYHALLSATGVSYLVVEFPVGGDEVGTYTMSF